MRYLLIFLISLNLFAQDNLDKLSKEEILKQHRELLKKFQQAQKELESSRTDPFNDPVFDDDMGLDNMMKSMHRRFQNFFGDQMNMPTDLPKPDINIVEREDEKNKYIDIDLKNIDKKSFNLKIENGMVNFSGKSQIEKKEQGQNKNSFMKMESFFNKTISVPLGVEENKAEVKNKEDKITIIFPKKIVKPTI